MTLATSADTTLARDLAAELERRVSGEVRLDDFSRTLYSTDASIYQMKPVGVVTPRDADDVVAVVELANREGIPVLPRGAGTSLSGQTVNHAIVLDFSRHLNRLLEVNPEEGWARVEPGIVVAALNRQVAGHRLPLRPRPLDGQPRYRRRRYRQQLLRHPLRPLRQDPRSGHRARHHPLRQYKSAARPHITK